MPAPCLCSQAVSAPTCALTAGAGIELTGSNPTTVTAISAKPWVAFVPATANFTLGNGVNASRYRINGKTIDILYVIKFGSTSTFSTTTWELGFPAGIAPFFDAGLVSVGHLRGRGTAKDVSAASPWFELKPYLSNVGLPVRALFGDDNGGIATTSTMKSTIPFTWANNDELTIAMYGIEVV